MSIEEILKKLLGDITPYGETNIDNENFNNIENYLIAISYLSNILLENAKLKNDNRYSVNKIGDESYNILKELNKELNKELSYLDEEV